MKERFYRFMQGRYGNDQLNNFTLIAMLILIVLSWITNWGLFYTLALVLLIWSYFRMLSRNIPKRQAENQKFLQIWNKVTTPLNKEKYYMEQRKTHHIYSCPNCKQKIRIPKGKGKIQITCPKCKHQFIKKS
ncbi:MAG: hypothetical protein ACI4C1_02420 [Lachnospiraceae bacterium]